MDAMEALRILRASEETMSDGEILSFLEKEAEMCWGEAAARAAVYNELGSVCRRNRLYEKGEAAFLEAASILENEGIVDGNYATTLNNLAGLYRMAGDYDKSLAYFSRCREIYAALPGIPTDILASSFNNMGLLYLDKKQYEKALEEFMRAEELITELPENLYIHAVTAGNKGYAFYGLGDMDSAAAHMLRAADFAAGFDNEMSENYRALYRRLGGKEEK